jgi:formylglycine-generating enzyme required for sulfatase activity
MGERTTLRALVALLLLAPAIATAQAQSWPEASTNPRPAEGDLVLPLPCGGAIAFRPVPVPAPPGLLADREVMLGQPDAETGYAEFLRRSFLAGSFPGSTPTAPAVFYMAKYEITRDQFAAVMADDNACTGLPSADGNLPRNDVAWHEAAAFTARLSRHLQRAAADQLPRVAQAVTFARLPTEDEWEFAARGGTAVPDSEFVGTTYPMPEGMVAYEYFQGSRSADGRVRPIGALRPNPLGLHDMLGNVAEWTLESYRLNRIGRAHGLAGGQVARGGHFRRTEDEIRASLREEHPPISRTTGEITHLATVGFRPVLTRETVAGANAARRLGEEFTREAQARDTQLEGDNPAQLIELLRRETGDEGVRTGLARLEARLQSEGRARRDQEAVSLRSLIEGQTYLARALAVGPGTVQVITVVGAVERDRLATGTEVQAELLRLQQALGAATVRTRLGPLADDMRRLVDGLAETAKRQNEVSRTLSTRIADGFVPQSEQRLSELTGQYLSRLVTIGRGADAARLAREGAVVVQDLATRRIGLMPELAGVVLRHLETVARGGTVDAETAMRDLAAVRDAASPAPRR